MNEIIKNKENVESKIHEIRGLQVMLDSDLALLYCVETKRINEAVKNNPNKFPNSFTFRISEIEYNSLKSKISTSKGGSRKGHSVFTEEGVAMLATILKSKVAIQVSINIMDTFVAMRKYLSYNYLEQNHYKNMLLEDHNKIYLLESTLNKLSEHQKINSIFFEGQIFDAYIFLIDLLSESKEEIVIIDNYAGKELFKIIKSIKVKVIIISKNIDNEMIKKYHKQYNNLKIKINNSFHDRFIIIDRKVLYHSGASFKDLGEKCFATNLIDDKTLLYDIINIIN